MYLECSALTGEGVEEVFVQAARLAFNHAKSVKHRRKMRKCAIL
jgi:hypothetical protein